MDMIKFKNKSGVYKLTNTINGKFYIGSTVDFYTRWYTHRKPSVDSVMSRAIRKHGVDNFIFEVVEYTDIDSLLEREQYYLDTLAKYAHNGDGYNVSLIATSGFGYKWSQEQKHARGISVEQYDFDGKYIKTYQSLADVETELGINHSKLSECINGIRRSTGNFQWIREGDTPPLKYERTNMPLEINMYNMHNEFILKFDSSWQAAKYLFPDLESSDKVIGRKAYSIQRCANGKRKSAFDFKWQWVSKE